MNCIQKVLLSSAKNSLRSKSIFVRLMSNLGTKEQINKLLDGKNIVVFMKGIPEEPRCGFSNAVVQIFKLHGVEKYDAYDVLADDDLRQGIKDFSKWPTIPQVFFNGEFIGGCDILLDMHKNGELIEELNKLGIRSKLLDDDDSK